MHRASNNPAEIDRNIHTIQDRLTGRAKTVTLDLAAAHHSAPDTAHGIRLRRTA